MHLHRRHPDFRRYARTVRSAGAAVLIGLLCSTSHQAVRAQTASYTFYQINAGFSPAMDVNDDGTVVGWWFGPPVSPDPNTNSMGYVWTFGTGAQPIITDPATVRKFPLYTAVNDPTSALRISATGTIAGTECPSGCGTSDRHAAIWNSSQGLVDLGSFDINAQGSAAAGINNTNQVVGFSWGGGYNNFGPFIWSATNGLQPLSDLASGNNGSAYGINSYGEVVGACGGQQCYTAPDHYGSAFFWSPTVGFKTLPFVAGSQYDNAFAINDSGVVIGRTAIFDSATNTYTYRVFRWSAATGLEDLNAPTGYPELMDINNAGDIVVTTIETGGRVPYLYQSGTWTNLNQLMPSGTGFTLQLVEAINNKGWIVGAGTADPNGAELLQGFVIVPPNQAPVASDGTAPVTAGSSVSGTLIATDPEGDSLTYSIVSNGTKGTAAITDAATGAYIYTANVGSSGSDTFTFEANDGFADSNTATITVTITPAGTCATDISTTATVSSQGPTKLNKKTGRYTQSLTLKNGDGAVSGPVSLVLDSLGSNATLFNATGTTACTTPSGSPYINVDVGADSVFSPRERATVTLEFTNPSGQPVTYTTRVLAGAGNR
jgi:hypothetical protein